MDLPLAEQVVRHPDGKKRGTGESALPSCCEARLRRYTISGKWGYLEHDWTATAGDFIYETPGEGHTLVAYEHKDPMKVFFVVKGPLIWLDEQGEPNGFFDVHNYIALCRDHYEKVGLGADYVKTLFR